MAIVNTGLVVRYYIDEAASGTTPTHVLDASGVGAALDLPIDYGSGNMAYTETVEGNRGLASSSVSGTQGARGAVNNTSDKVRDNLHGVTKATAEMVVQGASTPYGFNVSRIFGLFVSGGNSDFGFAGGSSPSPAHLRCLFNNVVVGSLNTTLGETRHVVHFVLDTTQVTAADRIKLYIDGVDTAFTSSTPPALNSTLSLSTDTLVVALGLGTGSRNLNGELYYGALYAHAFSAQDVSDNYNVLIADDDTPAGGGGQTITPPGIASEEAHGTPTLTHVAQSISVQSIASAEAFGSHALAAAGQVVAPSAITSVEAFGDHVIQSEVAQSVAPSAVPSAEAFGTATIADVTLSIAPVAIASLEMFGSATLTFAVQTISPTGIPTGVQFGPVVLTGGVPQEPPSGVMFVSMTRPMFVPLWSVMIRE